jgi:branched-chain amino acid transport system permease protein
LLTRTRIGLIIQAALTHPDMAGALGHNVPRVFTMVFAAGTALAGLAGVIGGNYRVTEPGMAFSMGPIVFVVVVFGGLGSLTGCFIASILMGLIQTFAVVLDYSLADLLEVFGVVVTKATPGSEFLMVTLPRIAALLPFILLVLILVLRPRGLLGTRDT